MAEDTTSQRSSSAAVIAVVVVLALAAIIAFVVNRGDSSTPEDEQEPVSAAERTAAPRSDQERSRARRDPDNSPVNLDNLPRPQQVATKAQWNPPRPLRFVLRHDPGEEARARSRAGEIRQRFLDGESSYRLIREHSDPPRGIPEELLEGYRDLRPDQASPVLAMEGAVVVFFGTPDAPPDAGAR